MTLFSESRIQIRLLFTIDSQRRWCGAVVSKWGGEKSLPSAREKVNAKLQKFGQTGMSQEYFTMANHCTRFVLMFALLGLAACATNIPRGLDQVTRGMDKDQVLNLAGNPEHVFRANDADHWVYVYSVENHDWRREITFEKGKVSGISRRQAKAEWVTDLEKTDSIEEFESKAREHQAKAGGQFKSVDGD